MMSRGRNGSMMHNTTGDCAESSAEQGLSNACKRENHKWTIWGLSVVFRSPYIPKVHGLCIEHSSRVINSHPMAITRMGGLCTNGVIGDVTGPCICSKGRARSISEFSSQWQKSLIPVWGGSLPYDPHHIWTCIYPFRECGSAFRALRLV
jgi:hypothetical protein